MAVSFSTSVSQASPQMAQQQARVQQAQRSADQAAREASSLQAQAQSAKSAASRAQQEARALEGQSSQADLRADRARQNLTSIKSESLFQQQLSASLGSNSATQQSKPSPVLNSQGQVTGQIINATA